MQHWAEQNSKKGCGIVSNSPNGRRPVNAAGDVNRDLRAAKRSCGQIWCRFPFVKMKRKLQVSMLTTGRFRARLERERERERERRSLGGGHGAFVFVAGF